MQHLLFICRPMLYLDFHPLNYLYKSLISGACGLFPDLRSWKPEVTWFKVAAIYIFLIAGTGGGVLFFTSLFTCSEYPAVIPMLTLYVPQEPIAPTWLQCASNHRGTSWKLARVKCVLIHTKRSERMARVGPVPLAVPRSAFLHSLLPSGTFVSQFV